MSLKILDNSVERDRGAGMDFNYEEYEGKCKEIPSVNDELLKLYSFDLNNLAPKTVRKHVSNVEFYINDYLFYEDALTFEYGIGRIDDFLGYFFIHKCMWSTPETIRSTATSIKKFYKCMLDHGKIQKKEYNYLCEKIRICMPQWQAACAQYNNIDKNNPFSFF